MSGKGVIRLECRPLEATDVKALQRVFIDSLSDLIRREAFDDAEVLEEEVERLNTTIQDSLADDDVKMYVVVKDGAIVGAAASLPPNEIITGYLEIETDAREIGCVYVAPHAQRQGVGTFLLEHMCDTLRREGRRFFYLDAGFSTAQAYWRLRLGEPILVLEHYWGTNAPHFIWRHQLT